MSSGVNCWFLSVDFKIIGKDVNHWAHIWADQMIECNSASVTPFAVLEFHTISQKITAFVCCLIKVIFNVWHNVGMVTLPGVEPGSRD